MRKIFFFIALSLCVSGIVRAQSSLTLYNYAVKDGLPSSEVYSIFQDSNKFIWFATENGVVKFDGKETEVFQVKEGLDDPVVFGFHEDQKGRIWFRTFSGKLFYYEHNKIAAYEKNALLSAYAKDELVYRISTRNEDLWFATGKIIAKITASGIVDTEKLQPYTFSYRTIGDDAIWGASGSSAAIRVLDIDHKKFPVVLSDTVHYNANYYTLRWGNRLYIAINNDVFVCEDNNVTKVYTAKTAIVGLAKDMEDNLWVGCKGGGATRFKNSDFSTNWKPYFLQGTSVTQILQDHEGGLWFSTLEKGVYYVPNLSIDHYLLPNDSKPTAVVSTNNGIWVGDQNGRVYAYDMTGKVVRWQKEFGSRILAMFYNIPNNTVWVSTSGGTTILNGVGKEIRQRINSYMNFSGGKYNAVWGIGYTDVSRLDQDGNYAMDTVTHYIYRTIFADSDKLFLSPRIGLHVADLNLDSIQILQQFSPYKISKIISLDKSTLFVATIGNGFLLVNKSNLNYVRFNSNNNFIADNIYDVVKQDSVLWLGTEKGLIKLKRSSLPDGEVSFSYVNERSGLNSDRIRFLAAAKNAIWVFSDEGIFTVPYAMTKYANDHPILYYKNVTVNGIPYSRNESIRVNYSQNNIQLNFGYISFNNPNVISRYRLDPSHPWAPADGRKLEFPSLSPGAYTIALEYSVDNIHWIASGKPVALTIYPPVWQRWYFQAAIVLFFLVIGFIYYKNRLLIYRQRHERLRLINDYQHRIIVSEIETQERERSRIAKDLHDGVSTNITALKLMINESLQQNQKMKACEIEEQFQNIIKEIKDIIYALAPPGLERYGLITSLRNHIEKLNGSVPLKINLNSFGKEIYDLKFSIPLFRVIQELISNSLKHARAANISIHINSFDDLLNITYEDDGVGFVPSQVSEGLGLNSVEARIQSIQGSLKFESGKFGVSYTMDIPLK